MLAAYDLEIERALLGTVMAHPDAAGAALLAVRPGDWWSPRHRLLSDLLTARLRAGEPIDPNLAMADVMDRGGPLRDSSSDPGLRPGLTGLDGSPTWVFELYQRAGHAEYAMGYAARIRSLAGLRNLSGAAVRLEQRLEVSWEIGDLDDVEVLTKEMDAACQDARDSRGMLDPVLPVMLEDLLAEPDPRQWLVPGLLERSERIMLTGLAGEGKSEMLAQFGCCLASGTHPFSGVVLGSGRYRARVLVVEFENSRGQVRRRYRRIAAAVDECSRRSLRDPVPWRSDIRLEIRPEGTDLTRADEVAWLKRLVASVAPEVLVIGPLYKLHRTNINDESAARELTAVLDEIRVRHQCALVMEHHPGHGKEDSGKTSLRPRGSSLFLGWPEFGFGFRRAKEDGGLKYPTAVDVVSWRGDREEREWPAKLVRGAPGELSWRIPRPSDFSDQVSGVEPVALDELALGCEPGCKQPCCA